jgi:methylated-DNA-[protein]-cysteine S-methyltransferase
MVFHRISICLLLVVPSWKPVQYYAMQAVCYTLAETPLGSMLLAGDEDGLTVASFQDGRHPVKPEPWWQLDPAPLVEVASQIERYFDGGLRRFDVRLNPRGTDFQRAVWKALVEVRFGETATYGDIARRLGKPPGAARAVGAANGANPIAVIIPCHRVVGEGGDLIGYGPGLRFKEFLLKHEGILMV